MAVTTPCYCSREQVARSTDLKSTARMDWQIDRAIQSAARNIEGHLHRTFYPQDATRYFDWPSFQYAYPWRVWLDQWDLAATPTSVTTGGVEIPLDAINFEPVNSGPPFTYMELKRNLSYSFGVGPTPQRDVAITGTWGYSTDTDPAGELAAAVSSTTDGTVTVSDGSLVGVGDLLIADTERMLVYARAATATGQTISGDVTASNADDTLTVQDGTTLHVDEVLLLDSERMLVVDVTGDRLIVRRAWDGTILAAHTSGASLYAYRALSVRRGQLGTTAATHDDAALLAIHRVPSLINDLAVAEASQRVWQETGGYSEPQGEGGGAVHALGAALPDLWDEAETTYGRKNRSRVI